MSASTKQAPVVLSMNALGWLAPAAMVALLILGIGFVVYPAAPWFTVAVAALVLLVLGLVGYRRRHGAQVILDGFGIKVRWRALRLDLPWDKLARIHGSTVWFEPSAVLHHPSDEVPPAVRRAVLGGRVPKIKLLTFTRSLADGAAGEVVRRHRPDLLP